MIRPLPTTLSIRTLCFAIALLCTFTTLTAQENPQSALPVGVYLEAECAALGDNWTTGNDDLASDTTYIVVEGDVISRDAPPADTEENLVTFTTYVQEADSLRLWGRVLSNSPDEDSFWVRINGGTWQQWSNRLRKDGEWIWREVAGSPFYVTEGTVTIDFTYREPNTWLDKIYLSSLRASPKGISAPGVNCSGTVECEDGDCGANVSIEVECAPSADSSQWAYRVDTENSSNSGYFVGLQPSVSALPTGTDAPDQLSYTVEIDSTADYYLYLRLNAPDQGKNSVFVKVDDAEWFEFGEELDGSQLQTAGFEWRQVNDAETADTITYRLEEGSHTIRLAKREAGTQLDKIQFSVDSVAPSGYGVRSLNCSPNSLTPVRKQLDLRSVVDIFPNPAGAYLNVSLKSNELRGRVQLRIIDLNGRLLSQQVYDKNIADLNVELDINRLPRGLYRLIVASELGITSRPFVKQ